MLSISNTIRIHSLKENKTFKIKIVGYSLAMSYAVGYIQLNNLTCELQL